MQTRHLNHLNLTTVLLVLFAIVLGLSACVPQTPIPIYVTPTPVVQESPTVTESPTTVGTPIPTAQVQVVPTTPAPTLAPNVTFIGPITGPDYTLQPTQTPKPTETPLTPPTPTPTFTPPGPPTNTPTPLPRLDGSRVGVQIHPDLSVGDWYNMLLSSSWMGVKWIKIQANWADLQPSGPDDFGEQFALFQQHVQAAKTAGFKVLIGIAKAPPWARPTNQDQSGPPDNPQDLANFINFLLSKIGDVIDGIEVWNEPNLIREWTGALPMTGAGYMQLFRPAYNAIRAYSPTMAIVTAGLAPTGDNTGTVDDRTFLQQMYNAGLATFHDIAVGIHPYSWGNPPDAHCCLPKDQQRGWDDDPHFFFADTIQAYRDIMVKNGQSDVQMWATEFGWATWDGFPGKPPEEWYTFNTVYNQADYTIQAIQIGQQLDYMGPMFVWNLNFANPTTVQQGKEVASYSLLMPNNVKRPLYYYLNASLVGPS